MGVKILERVYNEIFTDGDTDWLIGNVGDWQSLKLTVEVAVTYEATQQDPLQIDTINNAFILANGRNWGEYGFDNGMFCQFRYVHKIDTNNDGTFDVVNTHIYSLSILNVAGSVMEVSSTINTQDFQNIPVNYGNEQITDVRILAIHPVEGVRITYGHLKNEDYQSANLSSLIDGSTTQLVFEGLQDMILNETRPLEAVGIQSGMSIRNGSIKYLGVFGTNKRKYEITLNYMISSFFTDLNTFIDGEPPTYLENEGSLTDNFKLEFFPEWNNPNVVIQNVMSRTERLGNTGWFNENFNQLNNDFEIVSVEYFNIDGARVDALDYSSRIKAKVTIDGIPNLGSETECGFGFAWIPTDPDDYKNKLTPFFRNVFIQNGRYNDGFELDTLYPGRYPGAGVDGASMDTENVKFTQDGTDRVVMEVEFEPNANFFSLFDAKDENDRNYILWVSVADGTLIRNFSDRVSLLCDFNQLQKTIPPAGAYDEIDTAFLEHPEADDAVGVAEYDGLIQDDILARMPFRIKNDGSVIFQKITFGIKAYKSTTEESFDLQRYEVDLTPYPIDSDGIQQFNVDQTRGFKLENGNNKNWVKIQKNDAMDTVDYHGYLAHFGFKIRWEDWIFNGETPDVFFDDIQLNDGFNNDWYDYLITAGWEIKYFTEIVAEVDGELLEYENHWNFDFADYDQNTLLNVTHKYFRDLDNTLINVGTDPETGRPLGVIISSDPTRIEIEFEITDAGTWDLATTYGVVTLEIDFGGGQFEQRQLSSVWGSESDNPLIPLDGETKLKLEVDGTFKFLKMSCLVDPSLLDDAVRYRVTGRVGCKDDSGETFVPGLYEYRYESLYE